MKITRWVYAWRYKDERHKDKWNVTLPLDTKKSCHEFMLMNDVDKFIFRGPYKIELDVKE